MSRLEEIRNSRLEKIKLLKKNGMESFSPSVFRDVTLKDLADSFDDFLQDSNTISVVGRVMTIRGQGAIAFVVLNDGTGEFQVVFKKDEINESLFDLFRKTVDMGDFIQVSGEVFQTERGQNSILVDIWSMATKSLLPLPEKWVGLQDTEEKYRKRYLDILSEQEVFDRFVTRSQIIQAIRRYLDEKGFLEIETPILQNQAGGAMAQTFNTHHNDYDMDMVLRISLELEHKMLMVGGYNRIYEIGKNFRNEGSDSTHIQEFTMIEWYAAYQTLEDNMDWTEDMLKSIAKNIVGKTEFTVYSKEGNAVDVDFAGEWPRVDFADLLKKESGLDMKQASLEDIQAKALSLGIDIKELERTGKGNLLDFIFKKSARHKIINPTFVMNYPSELKPLAQQNGDGTARVAQLIIVGAEITNQYAELVNPLEQRKLLELQSNAKEAGDVEAMDIDERFLTAMEYGMPPMTGFGMGIDRLVAIFTEQKNLRDVIFFPIMRPKED
jgi:lysyl-tRNA synthetase class 2